ncbi:MAG TPA: pseudouridine synthase [Pyrinomonadaceae bacterium]|nr:pseudouridine synthase [Pyrinomonadaceae bacterium]
MKSTLPTVEGVGPSSQWLPAGPWESVLDFLKERFIGVETATWLSRMAKGQVVDETGLRLNPASPYRAGACIFYYRELESETRIPFAERVLYQDEHLLVVDKPHFLPVVPAGRFLHQTLLVRLKKQGQPEALVPVHRLDRETAGVVLFSLNPATRGLYTSLFRQRKVKKIYEALAPTHPQLGFPLTRRSRLVTGEPFFRMKEIEGEPNSETRVDVLKKINGLTLYQLSPVTGRKHQLRLHLSALGMPVVNDRLYPLMMDEAADDFSNPLKLLAKSISFEDPVTGRERHFESERTL